MRAYLAGLLGALTALALVGALALAVVAVRARSPRVDRAFLTAELETYRVEVYRRYPPSRCSGCPVDWRPLQVRFDSYAEQHRELAGFIAWCYDVKMRGSPMAPYCYDPDWARGPIMDEYLAARGGR